MTGPSDPGADRAVELPPDAPSTAPLWLLMLAGPILWIAHFAVVYLAAEAVCNAAETESMTFLTEGWLVVTVIAVTVIAAVSAALAAVYSWRRSRHDTGDDAALALAGMMLAMGSVVAILAVGLPALAFPPC